MYEYVIFIVVVQPVRICVNQKIYLLDQSATATACERLPSVLNFVLFVLRSFQLTMLCFVYSHLPVSRVCHSFFSLFSSYCFTSLLAAPGIYKYAHLQSYLIQIATSYTLV